MLDEAAGLVLLGQREGKFSEHGAYAGVQVQGPPGGRTEVHSQRESA
jgi:hypothetical protein